MHTKFKIFRMSKTDKRIWIEKSRNFLNNAIQKARPFLTTTKHFLKALFQCHKISYKQSAWYKKLLIIFLDLTMIFFLSLFCVDINFLWLFGKSPAYSVSVIHSKVRLQKYLVKTKRL